MRTSNALQIGKAGEYIVCADLIVKGLIAFPSEQGLPYDVLIDTGKKLLRCQVKTTEKPRVVPQRNKETTAYVFNVKRHGNSNNLKRYSLDEVDVFALVELETKSVVYLKNEDMPTTLNLRVDSLRGTYYDEKGIKDYETVTMMLKSGLSQMEVHRRTGLAQATVNRMAQKSYKPHRTKATYFSDLKKEYEWFVQI